MIRNIKLLVQMRWVAIALQMAALVGAIALHLPVNIQLFLFGLGIQIVINVVTFTNIRKPSFLSEWPIFFQLIFDLMALNIFMIASGGVANPFSGLFLIQAVLASMLLSGKKLWMIIAATGLSYTILLLGFNPSCEMHHQWMAFHIQGMIINHVMTTSVIGYFVFRLIHNLRFKEQQLSARQSLIGAGATAAQIAHKIGTPLNIMALVVQDLSEKNLHKDQEILLSQIEQCKTYLARFFDRLGRLEKTDEALLFSTTIHTFSEWIVTRHPSLKLNYDIVNDQYMSSMNAELMMLLLEIMAENAVEAQASTLFFEAKFFKHHLTVTIQNDGPPLPDEIQALMSLGYSDNKGIHHTGIGLFLARLVMENLGARVQVVPSKNVHLILEFPLESMINL